LVEKYPQKTTYYFQVGFRRKGGKLGRNGKLSPPAEPRIKKAFLSHHRHHLVQDLCIFLLFFLSGHFYLETEYYYFSLLN